jgi:hypothetical protein
MTPAESLGASIGFPGLSGEKGHGQTRQWAICIWFVFFPFMLLIRIYDVKDAEFIGEASKWCSNWIRCDQVPSEFRNDVWIERPDLDVHHKRQHKVPDTKLQTLHTVTSKQCMLPRDNQTTDM